MLGGVFEGANRSDFSDAKVIYKTDTIPGPHYHTITTRITSKYRYVRYVSPVGGMCNVSILEFYDENNQIYKGHVYELFYWDGEEQKWILEDFS